VHFVENLMINMDDNTRMELPQFGVHPYILPARQRQRNGTRTNREEGRLKVVLIKNVIRSGCREKAL